jgi:uncharacterized protein (DUF2249 family)
MPIDTTVNLDLRDTTPLQRQQMMFSAFECLEKGQSFQLMTDHDPKSLRDQLQMRWGDSFTWSHLDAAPGMWLVQIGKQVAAASSCCSGGACGG